MNPVVVIILGASGCLLLVLLVSVIAYYNSLVTLRNHIREAWRNIDTELKRRYELIPNLVSTVKGYAKHERDVLESVTLLVSELKRLLAIVENYPALKADRLFLDLQDELVNTEDRIQAARRFFNGNVRDYRNKCQVFPSNIVARVFGFQLENYFRVEPSVKDVPNLDFS